MDFHNMKRKELQALCKKHNIPANLSNSQMALNLSSLLQEREKPTKRGRASSKASIETNEEKDSSITTRQSKKVRFSPTNETFEYVELRSGHKGKTKVAQTKVAQTKSSLKPAAEKGGNPVVQEVVIISNKEVTGKTVRSLRSRVQVTMEGGIVPALSPPVGIQRGRRVRKDANNIESTEEIVIKPVGVTRSRAQTSSQGSSVLVPEQQVGKKRGRGRAVENVDGAEPVEDIASIPVRIMRSRAQIELEGGKLPALKPKGEKLTRAVVKVEPTKGIVDAPVRTTRLRVKTSKECGVSTMPSFPVEKNIARKGSKVGDASVQSTVNIFDPSDNVVFQKTASDQAEDLPSKRSSRKKELGHADIEGGENMWQKNQKRKTAKGTCNDFEDEPLAKDGGITEQPDLCLRRSTRNVVPARDTTISKRNSDETDMVGRGKITRSRNHLMKEDNDNRTEAATVVQRKNEVVLPVESLGRAGRNANRRKSVIPQETGNVVKFQGDSEVVPLLEEPERHLAQKGWKGNPVMPKIDEVKAAESKAEKGDILEENEVDEPYTSPLSRSRRPTSFLKPIAPADEDLTSPVVGGRKRSGKQSHAVSGANAVATAAGNNTAKKHIGDLNIDDPAVDVQDAPSVEESSRRVTRSATKSVAYQVTSSLGKIAGKNKQHGTVIPNSLVATPSGASAFEEESLGEAQVSMREVTEISTDLVSRSNPVFEDNSSRKRSERRTTRSSKQEGFNEVFAKPSILEQTKGQTSVSNSKRCQVGGEKEETSVRKRTGDHLFREDRLETSPKRFTRSATKHEKKTEWNFPENSAGKKTPQSRSRPPKLVVDIDSAGKGTPSMNSRFSMPEVLRNPTDLISGSTGVVKDRNSERNSRSSRSTRKQGGLQEIHAEASNVDELKGHSSSSISRELQTDDRQGCKGISDRKEREDIAFEEVDAGMKCSPSAGESSRRLTRSAFKSNSKAAINFTGNSVGKKRFKNQSETPKLEVKMPSSDRSLAIHELANINDAQFSLPEAVKSASGPSREVIGGTSTETRKKVSTSACALNEDGIEEVCARISNITKGKEQLSNLEETIASESMSLQIDDIEKEKVVSVNETSVIIKTVIAPVDGPTHVINGISSSCTDFSNLGLPNLEKEIPLEEGTSTHSIDIMPEVLATAAERSIEIDRTPGQESARQFIGSAGMTESESINFGMEFPSEENTSALEAALNIVDVPEVSGETNHPFLSSSGIFEHSSPSHIKNSSTGSHVNEEDSSEEVYAENLSMDVKKGQGQKEREMDNSVNEVVDVAENVNIVLGTDQEKALQCSVEMVNELGPGSKSRERSGLSGSSELADQEVREELSVTADDGFEGTTSTAVGCLPVEQSHSSTKVEAMHEPPTDTLPSPAASDVLIRDNGVNCLNDQISAISTDCSRLLKETAADTLVEDDLLAFNQSGGSREIDDGIFQDGGRANQDGSNLIKERNHDVEKTGNNTEFAKPLESSSSPARQSIELKISFTESRFDVEELPLQVPEVIEIVNTLSRSSQEPHVNTGPSASNETVDLVAMNLEKAQDFCLQTSQSEHKLELDLALEESSVDHNRNSGYSEIMNSRICDVAVLGTVGSDDFGFENKMISAAAEDDFTSCQEEPKFVESSELDKGAQRKGGENGLNSVEEISGSGSFNQEKDGEEILDINDNDDKASDVGALMVDTNTGSVCIDYQLQRVFESPASKDTQESENRVPEKECQPENYPSKEDQLQSEQGEGDVLLSTCEDIYFGDFVGASHDTMPTLFATPAGSSISSKNARSYCNEEMADIAFSDSKTREIKSGEIRSNCFKNNLENHTDEDKNQGSEMKFQMIFVKARQNSPPVSAEDHMTQIPVEASDRIIHEDDELSEGFDADGDTEQYFHSELTENADFENFGGISQEFLTEVAEMSGHDYANLVEPEVKDEVNRIDGHDRPMVDGNGEESGKLQPEEAPSDKNTRTEAPSDMTSRTDPSVSVDFAIYEGNKLGAILSLHQQ